MAGNAGQIRAGRAFVEAGWDDSAITKGLKATGAKLKAWGSSIQNIGVAVSGMAAAVTAPLVALAYKAADSGAELYRASQRTGVAVESLSELKYAAQQTGTDLEGLETGLRKMSKFVVAAAEGTDTAVQSLDHLGLTVDQLNGMKPEERFALIGDRLSKIADPTIRAATAMEVFGKSGTSLLPMLEGGSAGLEKWRQRARDLGLTTSGESAKAAVLFKQALNDLEATLGKVGTTVGQAVIPILKRKVELITGIVVKGIAWAKANKDIIATVFRVASAVGIAGIALVGLGTAVSVVGRAMFPLAAMVSAVGSALAFILSPLGLITAALVGLGAYFAYTTDAGAAATTYLAGAFATLAADVGTAIGGITDAIKAGDWVLAAEIAWTTLKIVWQRGVNELAKVWNAFGPSMLKFFSDTWTGVLALSEMVWDALRQGWIAFTTFFTKAWAEAVNAVKQLTLEITPTVISAVTPTGSLLAQDPTLEAQRKGLQAEANSKALLAKQLADADAEEAHDAEAKRHQDRMAQIAAEGQARGQAALQGTSIDEKALDDKLKALKESQQAQAQQAAKEAAGVKKPELPGLPKLPGPDELGLDDLGKRTSKAIGTFSAAAAARLGGSDDSAKQTAKNTKLSADRLKVISDGLVRNLSWS
jgi:hypothetical protein